MTDLKPEDRGFEDRLKLIPAYLRAAPMWREPHPYGGAPDVANEQYAKDIEKALSLLADRARMEKALREIRDLPFTAAPGRSASEIARQGLGASQ